jgi:hypothetical protein
MTVPRPRCAFCAKPYGRRETHTITLKWEAGEPEPAYEGYLIVVKRSAVRKAQPAMALSGKSYPSTPNKRDIEVWDGKTWFTSHEPFCTMTCALRYARVAYRKLAERGSHR